MSIRRFFAKTTSEALRKVRDELGSDGVILSNRTVQGGVEILALANGDIAGLIPSPPPQESGPALQPHQESYLAEAARQKRVSFTSVDKDQVGDTEESDSGGQNPDLFLPVQKQERRTTAAAISINGAAPNPAIELSRVAGTGDQAVPDLAHAGRKHGPVVKSLPTGHTVTHTERPDAAHPRKPRIARRAVNKVIPDAASSGGKGTSLTDLRQVADEVAASVLNEIKSMRGKLEQQLTMLAWKEQERLDPVRGGLVRQLQLAGFTDSRAHDLTRQLPSGIDEKDATNWAKSVLIRNLQAIANESEILEKGGVYALVGPTGVGKTTTTAKLAARCVVRHGADKLALLTTDGYRIGGHEQLRIYGKILGVTVHAVKDTHDLTLALAELRGKHLVLIDTVGMGQRDRMVAEQVAMLAGCGVEVKRLLLLNAASNGHTLDEVAHAYRGNGLAGAIITKLDESVIIGSALDTAIRHRLPLYYTAGGQRVPEDLELADPSYLVNCALDGLPSASPFDMPEDEFVVPMPTRKGDNISPDIGGIHLG
jgi:flagellar biosynthesis protein FlhF